MKTQFMRHSSSEILSDAQVALIERRRKTLGVTCGALLERFERALKTAGYVHTEAAAKMRLDRILNPRMRRPMSEPTKAALAQALDWTVPEFEAAIGKKKDRQVRRHGSPSAGDKKASARQTGFAALVQIESHQITRGVDLGKDNLTRVYEAAYRMFLRVRELIGELPVDEFNRGPTAQQVYDALSAALNESLRPHLTKWPEQYEQWQKAFVKTRKGQKLSAQQLQKRFPQRRVLSRDLKKVAQRLQADTRTLKSLIFAKGS